MTGHRKPLILAFLLALLPAGVWGQAPAILPFTLKQVGPGVYAAIDVPERKTVSNAGFVIGDDGVLVIDSFVDFAPAEALLAEIRKVTTMPVRYVVNTHFHLDHVTGNVVFHDAGALIITHRNARGWIKDLNMVRSSARPGGLSEIARAIYARFPEVDIVTDQPMTIYLGKRRIDIGPAAGHTGGDLTVSVPDAKVLFAGDLLWRRRVPTTSDGNSKTLLAELMAFERLPESKSTTFVPGHGEVMTAADVAEFRAHIADVSAETARARRAGLKGEALIMAVEAKLKPRYGDWAGFQNAVGGEIHAMDEELAGTKKVPQASPADQQARP
ncbi:MAG TPA: MBL fold metallo-hydrolase [Caulobacteraceae bacterium]|jgi:glyoxylase-like metal-dependent hydrolase (beta-lactamase superfamily II)|nr:MBL fold metallo-hydrolase [Caulobacteraceae bacterium]